VLVWAKPLPPAATQTAAKVGWGLAAREAHCSAVVGGRQRVCQIMSLSWCGSAPASTGDPTYACGAILHLLQVLVAGDPRPGRHSQQNRRQGIARGC
jgi:hypothetical protein